MALAALTSRAPDARIVASILDVATASTLDAFDRAAWTSLLSRNRLGRLIGAAARPYAPAMPARLSDLLGSSHPTTHWTRIQARSLRPVIVRTLPD
jgi:hypothetical protein